MRIGPLELTKKKGDVGLADGTTPKFLSAGHLHLQKNKHHESITSTPRPDSEETTRSQDSSFHALVGRLLAGDEQAAALDFRHFAQRRIGLAASRFDQVIRDKAGPDDVVQSVFKGFFLRQCQGQFELPNGDSLWDVLVLLTMRKCCTQAEYYRAARSKSTTNATLSRGPTPRSSLTC
jgi:hypothetical protein